MTIKFSKGFRKTYAEKVLDFANFGGGALIFTQALDRRFSLTTTIGGLLVLIVGFLISWFVYHKGGER